MLQFIFTNEATITTEMTKPAYEKQNIRRGAMAAGLYNSQKANKQFPVVWHRGRFSADRDTRDMIAEALPKPLSKLPINMILGGASLSELSEIAQ